MKQECLPLGGVLRAKEIYSFLGDSLGSGITVDQGLYMYCMRAPSSTTVSVKVTNAQGTKTHTIGTVTGIDDGAFYAQPFLIKIGADSQKISVTQSGTIYAHALYKINDVINFL